MYGTLEMVHIEQQSLAAVKSEIGEEGELSPRLKQRLFCIYDRVRRNNDFKFMYIKIFFSGVSVA